jgi:hypothetical protein
MERKLVSFLLESFIMHKYLMGSITSVMDYIYILFWNSLWTVAPVIGVGLFDRFLGVLWFSMILNIDLTTTILQIRVF